MLPVYFHWAEYSKGTLNVRFEASDTDSLRTSEGLVPPRSTHYKEALAAMDSKQRWRSNRTNSSGLSPVRVGMTPSETRTWLPSRNFLGFWTPTRCVCAESWRQSDRNGSVPQEARCRARCGWSIRRTESEFEDIGTRHHRGIRVFEGKSEPRCHFLWSHRRLGEQCWCAKFMLIIPAELLNFSRSSLWWTGGGGKVRSLHFVSRAGGLISFANTVRFWPVDSTKSMFSDYSTWPLRRWIICERAKGHWSTLVVARRGNQTFLWVTHPIFQHEFNLLTRNQ